MRVKSVVCIVVVGMSVLTADSGCSQNSTPPAIAPAASPPGAAAPTPMGGQVIGQIGSGELTGHTYTHQHFKLSVNIPDEWYIQKKSEVEQMTQAGSAMVQDPNTKAAALAAQERTLPLVSAFRHPPGTPGPFNSSMIVMAENVGFLPGLKQGQDYLQLIQKTMSGIAIKYDFDPIETGLKSGSLPADRLRAHTQIGGQKVNQEYYAARTGDYFLVVILSYSDDPDLETLRTVLESMKAG
jgi:hypothetical protein